MDRRRFIALSGLTAMAAGAGAQDAGKPGTTGGNSTPSSLILRRIPSSGELLPAIGLGTSGPFEVGADDSARAPLRTSGNSPFCPAISRPEPSCFV